MADIHINDLSINACSSSVVTSNIDSNNHICFKDNTNTGVPCENNVYDDKIFSDEGECLYQGSYTVSINNNTGQNCEELIDFEAIIDSMSANHPIPILQDDIKEFETILNSFVPNSTINVEEDLNLNEINDFINTLDTENNDLNLQEFSNIENNTCTINSIDNNITSDCTNENFGENADIAKNIVNLQENDTALELISLLSDENVQDTKIDIISISSEHTQNSDDDGYNSSDFEFITESEAMNEGYIINFSRDPGSHANSNFESKTKNIPGNFESNIQVTKNDVKNTGDFQSNASNSQLETSNVDPREGQQFNSNEVNSQSGNKSGFSADPSECPRGSRFSNRPYRSNHVVPEGEGYLDLFRGPYDPVLPLSDIIFMENKSIRPSAMNTQYAGIGFDQQLVGRRYQPNSSEEEYEDEAKESKKKILSMYPAVNRRRKGRRH